MPFGAASHQDEDRLLQGWKAQRDVSERRVRLPPLWIPTAAGPELSKRGTVLQLHTRGQFLGTASMRATIRDLNIRQRTQLSLAEIARKLNPLLSGWIDYYGRYAPSALSPMLRYVNLTLLRWAMRKFKRFKAHKIRASHFLQRLARDKMSLFVHWRIGMTGTFA